MPKFYFDVDDGSVRVRDEVGVSLSNEHDMRNEGMRAMVDLAAEYIRGENSQRNLAIWVRNEAGEMVLQLALNFTVRPVPK